MKTETRGTTRGAGSAANRSGLCTQSDRRDALVTGSVRSIQIGLELLFGVQRSVGHISQTLQAAGAAAEALNGGLRVPLPVLGEADEIFAGRKPCLTVVDGRSFLVLNLAAAESRDATHWGLTFLDLAAQGVSFQDVAADGARGIRAGLKDAVLAVPLRPDLFHLLQDGKRLANRLEKAAYKAIRIAEKALRTEQEAQQPTPRRGRPLQVDISAEEAFQREAQAIATYDHFCWLLAEIRQSLEPITDLHRLQVPDRAQETLETAIELLQTLPGKNSPTSPSSCRTISMNSWLPWSGCIKPWHPGAKTCQTIYRPGSWPAGAMAAIDWRPSPLLGGRPQLPFGKPWLSSIAAPRWLNPCTAGCALT